MGIKKKRLLTASNDINHVWWRWIHIQCENHPNISPNYGNHHSNLRYSMSMRFQNWLFDQGAVIRQKNKKLYLEFADPGDAITFKFKYCIR